MTIRYFAYGSNMLESRIVKRVSSAKFIGRATLSDWGVDFSKRSIDGSGKANLFHELGFVTWGCLYSISDDEINKLDNIEKGYIRITINVKMDNDEVVEAETYVSEVLIEPPVAFDSYKEIIISGANEHDFPKEYVRYLQGLPSKPKKAG